MGAISNNSQKQITSSTRSFGVNHSDLQKMIAKRHTTVTTDLSMIITLSRASPILLLTFHSKHKKDIPITYQHTNHVIQQ